MTNKMYLLVPLVVLISTGIAFGGVSIFKKVTAPEKAHYHAGFQIYVDGKLKDFAKQEYMKETPCAADDAQVHVDEQLEKAHLHDLAGNVVHSHRKKAIWEDLFTNIKYSLDQGKPVKSYINGQEVDNIETQQIQPYDSVVILIGKNNDIKTYLPKAVTKSEIEKEEKKSENCGT